MDRVAAERSRRSTRDRQVAKGSVKADKRARNVRLVELDDDLGGDWSARQIAELIFASAHDWCEAPCAELVGEYEGPTALTTWIQATLRNTRRTNRQ
ncbi:MAG: hypothetical protein NT062_09055 [Proteobacteria bacterium]|nr:hypothetical protein [Pseudomonadota bacterium]